MKKNLIPALPEPPIPDDVFDALEWEAVEDVSVYNLLPGKTIVGVELCGYPMTDGLFIYYREDDGRLWVLDCSMSDEWMYGPDTTTSNPLIFQRAVVPIE